MPEAHTLQFYSGSRFLLPWCETIGLPLDQLNFIVCQLAALLFGFFFRQACSPTKCSPTVRHLMEAFFGIGLTIFCFGNQISHLIIQSALCILCMKCLPTRHMALMAFIISLAYLCIGHIWRQIYDYGGYTMDITGPLMINTQRLSSLAFSIKDGREKDDSKQSSNIKAHAVKYTPSLLEMVSYIFSFHGAMCGPFVFFKDYSDFIEGKGVHKKNSKTPSPTSIVCYNLFLALLVFAPLTMFVTPLFPSSHITSEQFYSSGFFSKILFIVLITSAARAKYYFAWSLAEAVNNNAGLGYEGKDENGKEKWGLISNASPYKVECCTSLKVLLDNWNITTTYWLRYTVYERMPFMSTMSVFMVSAFWHGFYPGYYLTFFTGLIFNQAGRQIRRHLRPLFQSSKAMAFTYDAITCFFTRITLAYLTFPFVLLEFMPSFKGYLSIFFSGHIITVSIFLIGTFCLKKPKPKTA